jgi:hypothetical protein
MAWSVYRNTVAEVLAPPTDLILFCALSIGHTDPTHPHPQITRAPLAETVTFLD